MIVASFVNVGVAVLVTVSVIDIVVVESIVIVLVAVSVMMSIVKYTCVEVAVVDAVLMVVVFGREREENRWSSRSRLTREQTSSIQTDGEPGQECLRN